LLAYFLVDPPNGCRSTTIGKTQTKTTTADKESEGEGVKLGKDERLDSQLS